ncbi:hypothetical protein IW261DRAFT_1414146 [Armillaria novae-zelandiae]|uniref:Uncharacterized protein n=1 Tax=Armillaria novae-zelandiae TaxID=153914 RepID=A0AA39PRC6_9AGAR|nr:hypothetical protein IW261DRAFT_1414146 [Armillaria novae-zelandiae]
MAKVRGSVQLISNFQLGEGVFLAEREGRLFNNGDKLKPVQVVVRGHQADFEMAQYLMTARDRLVPWRWRLQLVVYGRQFMIGFGFGFGFGCCGICVLLIERSGGASSFVCCQPLGGGLRGALHGEGGYQNVGRGTWGSGRGAGRAENHRRVQWADADTRHMIPNQNVPFSFPLWLPTRFFLALKTLYLGGRRESNRMTVDDRPLGKTAGLEFGARWGGGEDPIRWSSLAGLPGRPDVMNCCKCVQVWVVNCYSYRGEGGCSWGPAGGPVPPVRRDVTALPDCLPARLGEQGPPPRYGYGPTGHWR